MDRIRTLEQLTVRYARAKLLAAPTVARYELAARNLARCVQRSEHASPASISLEQIDGEMLLDFRDWSLQHMRPVTFNTERRHLCALFNYAARIGAMDCNPFREVPAAPVPQRPPRSLPKPAITEYIRFLETANQLDRRGRKVDLFDGQWFWLAVLRTFYLTGMRKRQLIGLKWGDLNFDDKIIRLTAEYSKTRREWLIPLPDTLLPDLRHLKRRTIEIVGADLAGRQVFCWPLFAQQVRYFRHKELRADALDNFFQRLRKAVPVDLPRLSSHRIRHTTATILANSVPNLKVVQELLGHASISTTYGYVHPDLEAMRDAVNVL